MFSREEGCECRLEEVLLVDGASNFFCESKKASVNYSRYVAGDCWESQLKVIMLLRCVSTFP